ncbi:MAG: long-chain fatty acid--CoA ligase [Deltaproteobacteria bacterium]|nr:long-chain fatty acid--CoA ligase [Deltaproteobacteria bacterium]
MNIGTLLTKSAQTFPDNLAIAHGKRRYTYAQFNARANRLANALRGLGVQQGDNVALLQYNYPEMLESMFGCFKAGCGAAPINFRLHPEEYAFIIDHSESKAVIFSSEFNQGILSVREKIPGAKRLITLADPEQEMILYEDLLAPASDAWDDAAVQPDGLAWLFYTSGTTGLPKGAMLTHRNLLAMSMNFYADICPGCGPQDAILHAAPLSHGSGCYALPNVGKAAANIILESKSFDAELVFRTIQEYRITNMFAAPTMVKLLVDSPSVGRYDHSSLKSLVYGGGPMLVEDSKEALRKLGPCLVQLYGQAESPMTITYLPHRDHVLDGPPERMRRLASAGFARTDVEVKIFDENDNEAPRGQMGEIVTRSDLAMKGYWRNPQATAETLRNGWVHTGDLGYMDDAGYVFIMDRSKDMIITGGENVYPREVEEVIIRHPSISEVAVVGVPDPKWGEAIKAVCVLKEGHAVSEQEIIDFCRDHIAGYKKPKSIDFVDALPKNNYGKVLKREIRGRYWQDRERKV